MEITSENCTRLNLITLLFSSPRFTTMLKTTPLCFFPQHSFHTATTLHPFTMKLVYWQWSLAPQLSSAHTLECLGWGGKLHRVVGSVGYAEGNHLNTESGTTPRSCSSVCLFSATSHTWLLSRTCHAHLFTFMPLGYIKNNHVLLHFGKE